MLKIWGRKTSSNVQKPMWAIGELGLAHERMDVGGAFGKTGTPEYIKMNPNKLVPVLQDGALTMYESNAITRYIAATYGKGSLAPIDPHMFAKADQWMDWTATTWAPANGGAFWWFRTPPKDRPAGGLEAATKKLADVSKLLDAELAGSQFLIGPQLTMADIIVGTFLYRYYTMPFERPARPNIDAYYQRLTARKAYQEHVMVDWKVLMPPDWEAK
jgi:glutathione S-transferase